MMIADEAKRRRGLPRLSLVTTDKREKETTLLVHCYCRAECRRGGDDNDASVFSLLSLTLHSVSRHLIVCVVVL